MLLTIIFTGAPASGAPVVPTPLLCLTWYACMHKRLKYLPAHVIHILVCGFGSAMTRNTVYKRVQSVERDIDYLQVRECIPCMNEYQGRNNGWAEMSKLMLNLGAQPNTHTHYFVKFNIMESDLKLHLANAQQHTCIRVIVTPKWSEGHSMVFCSERSLRTTASPESNSCTLFVALWKENLI